MRWYFLGMVSILSCTSAPPDSKGETEPSPSRLSVYAVSYPLQYFAERIGGEHVDASFPAPPDVDPAYWSPAPEVISEYQSADVILLNGAGYARWVERASLPASKLVDTSAAFRDRYIAIEGAVVHSHGPEGEHSHGETAFTTWVDPTLAVEHAKAVLEAMVAARPEHEAAFREGYRALEAELRALDVRMARAVAGKTDRPLVGSHPVYQYLARRYGLDLPSVHFEPDAIPGPEGLRELERLLDARGAKWMIWESEPLSGMAERLREMGLESVVFDPCANRPATGDYLSVMEENVAAFERVFASP